MTTCTETLHCSLARWNRLKTRLNINRSILKQLGLTKNTIPRFPAVSDTEKMTQYDVKSTMFEIFAKGLIMKDIMSLISVITKLFRFHLVWIPTTSLLAVMVLEVKLRWRKTHQILLLSFGTGYVSQGWSQAHHLMTDQTQNHQNHLFHPC